MHSNIVRSTFIATVLLGTTYTTARADLPKDQVFHYNIREEPTYPNSKIIFIVELEVEAIKADGDWVGWEIMTAEFFAPGTGGETVWFDDSPGIDTPDGLWWIEHADPEDPQLSEFLLPPLLEGVAAAEDPKDDDLEYMVEGVVYDPPRGRPPFEPTAALDYRFALVGQRTPPEEGEDEPVEPKHGPHDPE